MSAPVRSRTAVYADGVYATPSTWWRAGEDTPTAQGVSVVYAFGEPPLGDGEWEVTGGGEHVAPWRWRDRARGLVVVSLDACEGGEVGPWEELTPRELVHAFRAFRRLVGVDWADSTGRTAERLIIATHPVKRGGVLLDRDPVTPEPATDTSIEAPYSWRRDLTAAEAGCAYVHCFDANAQYLAAWGSVELGHGAPLHHTRPSFDRRVAALWEVDGLPPNLSPLLPPVASGVSAWLSTPTLARVLEVCDGTDAPLVLQSWAWPRKSRFLRSAAERLRDARADARAELAAAESALAGAQDEQEAQTALRRVMVAGAVSAAVKDVYARGTGRFASAWRSERSGWRRPDWYLAVVAQARCNLHRRLSNLTRAPFAIATDGLLFASDEADPAAFAASIGLPLGDGLGQYSHEGSGRSGPVFAELAAGASLVRLFRSVLAEEVAV